MHVTSLLSSRPTAGVFSCAAIHCHVSRLAARSSLLSTPYLHGASLSKAVGAAGLVHAAPQGQRSTQLGRYTEPVTGPRKARNQQQQQQQQCEQRNVRDWQGLDDFSAVAPPSPSLQQQQQQQRGWQQQQYSLLQPDPAADDLDVLAAAASSTVSINSSSNPAAASTVLQATAAPISPITSIPEGGATYALPAGRTPRYTAADKLQLSGEEMRDIGRRLRRPLRGTGPVLRVFRYGVDDFRLYKALDMAGLEGRVVMVDSTADADAVLTTYTKRTRKNVNLATAKRAAAGAGVPLLVLPAVSAQRLLDAVGPLLGLPTVEEALAAGDADAWRYSQQQAQLDEVRVLRWDELEADGSEELLQLMWSDDNSSSTSSSEGSAGGMPHRSFPTTDAAVAGACYPSPRWRAWCAAQAALPACSGVLFDAVRDADVEDTRDAEVPINPTARAGERHRLLKPLRPYSRIRRRKLRKELEMQRVSW